MASRRLFVVPNATDEIGAIELPREGHRLYRDSRTVGLVLRVSKRGKTWLYRGRSRGMPRRIPLGKWPRVSLEQARAAAARVADHGAGVANSSHTLGSAVEEYLASTEHGHLATRTRKSYRNTLRGRDIGSLHGRRLAEIQRTDILALRDSIAREGRAYQNILRPLAAMLSWCVDRQMIPASPATRLRLPANRRNPRPFTVNELGDYVHAIRTVAPNPFRVWLLLCADTGARPATFSSARWDEFNLRAGVFLLAPERAETTKLGHSFSLPLATQVVKLLREEQHRQGRDRNEWLLGRDFTNVEQWVRNAIAKASKVKGAYPYRLRSTFLTWLSDQDAPLEVSLRLGGHNVPGSRAHYLAARPTPPMVEWAKKYAHHVDMAMMFGEYE